MPGPGPEIATAAWVQSTTAAVARGDRGALAELYERWFDECYRIARGLTRRDESFCLDVVQETMLRVIRSLRRLETEAQLRAWAAGTAPLIEVGGLVVKLPSSGRDALKRAFPRSGTIAPR